MKKSILLIFFTLIVLISTFTYQDISLPNNESQAFIYIASNNSEDYDEDLVVNSLGLSIYKTSLNTMKEDVKKRENFKGVAVIYEDLDLYDALNSLKAKLVDCDTVDGITIYYAYSKYIKTSIERNNKKINVQIACKNGKTKIGIPMLYGSF